MGTDTNTLDNFESRFSFAPLIRSWKKVIDGGREGNRELYQQLLDEVSAFPELLVPIADESLFVKHEGLINRMMSTVFPVTLSEEQDLFAISLPFQYKVIYSSKIFKHQFLDENHMIRMPDAETAKRLLDEKIAGAYQLILNRLYNVKVEGKITSVHPYKCPISGLDKFMELEIDTRFIDVYAKYDLPSLPTECVGCFRVTDIMNNKTLHENIRYQDFIYEGMVVLYIREVTDREIINKIKNSLLHIHSFADEKVFDDLEYQMQNLLYVHNLHTAIKPFFKVNNHLVLSEILTTNTTAKKYPIPDHKQYELYKNILANFSERKEALLVNDINEEALYKYPFLYILHEHRFKSVILCPLFNDDKNLLGLLIIAHRTETFTKEHIARIEPAIPLFALALEKSQEQLDHQVDKVIREQFTAVQPAVEWKFTEAALSHLTRLARGEQNKIEPIIFDEVFPLYGAVDIRNSSVERNNAIQSDLLEQLEMAGEIIRSAHNQVAYPLLEELLFRIGRYRDSVSNILFAEEETAIHNFLSVELIGILKHLAQVIPAIEKKVNQYLSSIDSPVKMLYHHRKEYEESISRINNEVAAFIDGEQGEAQSIYPHYFERFVTDGLDFNIYIGQSISPTIAFDEFYLKNLKMWQLSTLVRTAQLTHRLEKELPLPLKTTQLILAHNNSISISFRTAERKFDVDGAYNIRYEIMKKRIDKVRLKDSNERLTQPGTVAIVYSHPKEAQEYIGYIEFLQSRNMLKDEIEKYDLEELQGISGLKGLRVSVNFDQMPDPIPSPLQEGSRKLQFNPSEL